jgi:hypothetical protein
MQHISLAVNNGPLDDILQFADIAGPRVILKRAHGSGRDGIDLFPEFSGRLVRKVFR